MDAALLSLIMDFVVLLALAGTIYFVMRLSRALENFRAHRDEMKKMVLELSMNIDQAQEAINNLKASSNSAADDLEEVLYDSRRMAEELKIINDTSDSLASRLEGLAQSSRRATLPETGETSQAPEDHYDEEARDELPSFFIKDNDFEERQEEEPADPANESGFSSKAEQELYDALQKNKAQSGGA